MFADRHGDLALLHGAAREAALADFRLRLGGRISTFVSGGAALRPQVREQLYACFCVVLSGAAPRGWVVDFGPLSCRRTVWTR